MPATVHSTADVPMRQSVAYWQDWVCEAFVNMDCAVADPSAFAGNICSWQFSSLYLTTMVADRMRLLRSPARIAKAREDCLLVALEARTESMLVQDGREGLLRIGDFALVDSTRPYTVLFQEGFEHRVLRFPRRGLLQRIGTVDALTGVTISGSNGAGRLASTFLQLLATEIDALDAASRDRVAETMLDLLAVALANAKAGLPVSESATRTALFVRARNYVESGLSDPNLARAGVAAALGVSVRYLSTIFSANGLTVDDYIWERRLQKCRAALADRSQLGRSILSIAFGWGFNDMSHFSRAFKSRFGFSPRAFRVHCAELPRRDDGGDPTRRAVDA
jgi:AraC-like DNA-binding protein